MRLGEHSWLSTQACQLGDALQALGRDEEAEHWALRGLELGSRGDVETQLLGFQVRSKLLARRGANNAAIRMAEQANSLAAGIEAPLQQGVAALTLAGVLFLGANPTRAEAEIRRAIGYYERKRATAYVERARGLAAT